MSNLTPYTTLLLQALASTYGVSVSTSNVDQLRQKLYAARREDPETFAPLSFRPDPDNPSSVLLILKLGEPNGNA